MEGITQEARSWNKKLLEVQKHEKSKRKLDYIAKDMMI
jgi:hypothetical protein